VNPTTGTPPTSLLIAASPTGPKAKATTASLTSVDWGCCPAADGAGLPDGSVAVAEVPQATAMGKKTGIQRNLKVALLEVIKLLIKGSNYRFSVGHWLGLQSIV